MQKKNRIFLVVLILAGLSEMVLAGSGKAWYGFDEGIALAKKENKHVIIDFYADWCSWCKVMDQKTFSDAIVEKYLFENFIPIRINSDNTQEKLTFRGKTFTPRELTSAFQVTGLPSIAFISSQMEVLGVIPGYIEKDRFLNLLKYVHQECYKTGISLDEFIKSGCGDQKGSSIKK